jgi:hypothetical protein
MRGEREGVAGSQPMNTAVQKKPNKLWRSNSIFNLCSESLPLTPMAFLMAAPAAMALTGDI